MKVIRGAVCAENTIESISENSIELIKEIILHNNIATDDIICILFSVTKDLNKVFPAKAVRETLHLNCAFECFQEMDVEGAIENCIRATVFVDKNITVKNCYLGETKLLRPDLN